MPVLPAVPSTMTPPGLNKPRSFGVLDNGQRRTILDRAAGIEEFRLAENGAPGHLGAPS